MKTINLEEILKNQCKITYERDGVTRYFTAFERSIIIKAMKEACKQTLELAAENASVEVESKMVNIPNGAKYNTQRMIVNKKSILDIINQIE